MRPAARHVDRAIAEAAKSPHTDHRHGAVIILKDGHLISGYNNWPLHAEHHAIIKAGSRAKGATLLVVRAKGRDLKNSRPCPACAKLVEKYNLTAWHSDADGHIVRMS